MRPIHRMILTAGFTLALSTALTAPAFADHDHGRRGRGSWGGAPAAHVHGPRCDHPYGGSRYGDPRCGDAERRIHEAVSYIRQWEGTGRHRKALRWYKDDLYDARRDLAACRTGGRFRDDRVFYDDGYDGPYERPYDRDDFDLGRDWPTLLGLFLDTRRGY